MIEAKDLLVGWRSPEASINSFLMQIIAFVGFFLPHSDQFSNWWWKGHHLAVLSFSSVLTLTTKVMQTPQVKGSVPLQTQSQVPAATILLNNQL